MCTSRSHAGFTLIELIIFIVIVSVGLAGVLLIFNTVTRGSADPVRAKQALAVAEGLMDEVLAKSFCDPDAANFTTAPVTCGANVIEASRSLYDSVDDYQNYNPGGVRDITGTPVTALSTYNARVQFAQPASAFVVGSDSVAPANYRIVTVTVSDTVGNQTYTLTAYKFNND